MASLTRSLDTTLFVPDSKSVASNKLVYDNTDEGGGADNSQNLLFTKVGPPVDYTKTAIIQVYMRIEVRCTDTVLADVVSHQGFVSIALEDATGNALVAIKPTLNTGDALTLTQWDINDFSSNNSLTPPADLSAITGIKLKLAGSCSPGPNYSGMIITWNVDLMQSLQINFTPNNPDPDTI